MENVLDNDRSKTAWSSLPVTHFIDRTLVSFSRVTLQKHPQKLGCFTGALLLHAANKLAASEWNSSRVWWSLARRVFQRFCDKFGPYVSFWIDYNFLTSGQSFRDRRARQRMQTVMTSRACQERAGFDGRLRTRCIYVYTWTFRSIARFVTCLANVSRSDRR